MAISDEMRDPKGAAVGIAAGGAAWLAGAHPLAAAGLAVVVMAVKVATGLVCARPRETPEGAGGQHRPAVPPTPLAGAVPAPPPDGVGEGVFEKEGEYWTVGLGGRTFRLRDAKGLRYLQCLLGHPGREFHVLDLVHAGEGAGARRSPPGAPGEARGRGGGDAGPLLDARAKAAYRNRLEDLREEVDEARGWGDAERAARAEEEIQRLAEELARAVGLGGRDRKAGSEAERARVNVTRAIRATIDKVAEHDPSLAHHLSSTVRTGTFCSYVPDPARPPSWRL